MPNIEIYDDETDSLYENLKGKIDQAIKNIGLENDAITTWHKDAITESCDSRRASMPYIRICSTNKEEIEKIVQALKENKIWIDVETLQLSRFIPANEMK